MTTGSRAGAPDHSGQISRMRLALAWLVFLCVGCSSVTPELVVEDPGSRLDRDRVAAAAAPLLQRRATVWIIVLDRVDPAELRERMRGHHNGIGLAVGFEPRYSELRLGSWWSESLPSSRLEQLRSELVGPLLRSGRAQQAVVAALTEIDRELARSARQQAILGWGIAALLGIGSVLWWLRDTAACRWLWGLTPWARSEVRRRAAAAARARQAEIEGLEAARGRLTDLPASLETRLQAWDAGPRTDMGELRALRRSLDELESERQQLRQAGHELWTAMEALRSGARAARKRKKHREQLRPDGLDELSALEAVRPQGLEETRELRDRALALWQRELPRSYARARPPATDLPWLTTPGPSPVPSSTAESSSDTWDPPSGSSGESFAAGDW